MIGDYNDVQPLLPTFILSSLPHHRSGLQADLSPDSSTITGHSPSTDCKWSDTGSLGKSAITIQDDDVYQTKIVFFLKKSLS